MPKSEQEHIDTTVNPKEEPTPEYVELPTDAGAFLEQISPQLYQVHFGTKVNFPVDGAPFVQGQTIVVGTARRLGDGPSFQATAALLTARNAAAEAMVNGEIDTVVEVHEEGGEAILNSSWINKNTTATVYGIKGLKGLDNTEVQLDTRMARKSGKDGHTMSLELSDPDAPVAYDIVRSTRIKVPNLLYSDNGQGLRTFLGGDGGKDLRRGAPLDRGLAQRLLDFKLGQGEFAPTPKAPAVKKSS